MVEKVELIDYWNFGAISVTCVYGCDSLQINATLIEEIFIIMHLILTSIPKMC